MHVRLFARMVIEVAMLFRNDGVMHASACLCLEDAVHLFARGEYKDAFERAYTSLQYSVGVFSPVYEWAAHLNSRI